VVVTANRFEQKQDDEPVRISVITSEDIVRSGARTIHDVLAQEAGLNLIDLSGSPNKQIDLRGFGMSGDQNTLILLDGQRITENELASADLASIPLASIERIEILRGSGAVLYGRGATGGTINIITKRNLDQKNAASVQLQAGNYGTWGAATSARVAGGPFGLTVFAERNETDNYRRNNQLDQQNLTADLTYRGDRGPVSLRLSSGNQNLRFPGSRTRAELLTDPRGTSTPTDFAELDTARLALGTEQRFGFGFVGLDLTHRTRETLASFWGSPSLTKANATSVSPRVRIPFNLDQTRHSLIVGADWDQWNWDNFSDPASSTPGMVARQENTALYFRHTIDFSTGTTVAFGARQQRIKTEATDNDFALSTALQSKSVSASELAIRQRLADEWIFRAKVGKSFRLQTVDELRVYSQGPMNLLEPQTSTDLEASIVYEQASQSMGFTVYQSRLENEIHCNCIAFENINLPPTQRRGVELDGKWVVSKAVTLGSNYTYADATFRSGELGGVAVAGKTMPLVPQHKFSASLNWKVSERSSMRARATYVGAARLDNDQANDAQFMRPAYALADLVLHHDAGPWRLRASALNIFNESYFSYGIRTEGGASFSAYPALGRTLLLSAEYRF